VYKQEFSCKINCTGVKNTATKLHVSPDKTDMAWRRETPTPTPTPGKKNPTRGYK